MRMRDAPRFPKFKTKKYHFLPQKQQMPKTKIKTADQITLKSIDDLIPYKNNSRTHSSAQIKKLQESINQFGFVNPVLIDSKNVIIAGHGRVQAAKSEGMESVPCLIVDHLTPQQIRAYIIADNRLAEDAGWNDELLKIELSELKDAGFDLSFTGFNQDEIEGLLLDDSVLEDNFDVDKALEADTPPLTQLGDIWQLGRHKVLCGDATKSDDISKLMDGKTANLLVTDPPYNVNYEGTAGKIQNDNMSDDRFHQFLVDAFNSAVSVMRDGASFYICHADSEGFNFRSACREADLQIRQCLIWVKNSLVLGRQDYNWRHEPILYGWKDGSSHFFTFDRTQTTVFDDSKIDINKLKAKELKDLVKQLIDNQINSQPNTILYEDKPAKNDQHPTMKPIKLIARLIANSSRRTDIVLDPFLGSGSTLMASDQLNRTCYGMELDPRFVDVIVKRFIASDPEPESAVKCIRNGKQIKISESFFI